MIRSMSLRARLTLIVLVPLMAIATLAGLWQLTNARQTAAEVFDRSLLSAALAVSNDVAISGGDALSPQTRAILSDTSGGLVYYHVYAPDGVIVAGYATPPVGIPRTTAEVTGPTFFEARYLGLDVRGVRLQSQTEIEGFSGTFTTTVWQETTVRNAFVRDLVTRSLVTICVLIASVALVVWFGIRLGLRPLVDLQDAIEQRSGDELSPIRRPVPEEVRGIVETLNRLFGQVSRSMNAQAEFVSNAAHQLRNPIAGVLSLAEAVHKAPTLEEARTRSADLITAAREAADLSNKLLTIERAKSISPSQFHRQIDLAAALEEWLPGFQSTVRDNVEVTLDTSGDLDAVRCDPTMLREAVANLVDNASKHGGPDLSRIAVSCHGNGATVALGVADDGRGIAVEDIPKATERFSQVSTGEGSGLGLTIAEAVAAGHGGKLQVTPLEKGVSVTLEFPSNP